MPSDTQLQSVLEAAGRLLSARQDQMVTAAEWVDLARTVAACTGRKTRDLLTERDLEQVVEPPAIPWDDATDGPLASS